jgi:hypothetical protein
VVLAEGVTSEAGEEAEPPGPRSTVNTKQWYRRRTDLWAELGDEISISWEKSPQRNR